MISTSEWEFLKISILDSHSLRFTLLELYRWMVPIPYQQQIMTLGAPFQANSTLAPAQLTQVAQTLSREQEGMRIKKLLIYVCQQTWQSDVNQIHAIDLKPLLQKLLIIAPTPDKLHAHLHNVVGTLNKSDEYALVAETIIQHVDRLYPPVQARGADPIQTCYQSIATLVQQDIDQIRIKKLLYLSCKNTWLSDLNQLAQLNLVELIRELHHLAPTPEQLQQVLRNRVKKLSKREEYTAIAKRLFQLLRPLYIDAIPKAEETALKQEDTTEFLSQLMTRSVEPIQASVKINPQPAVSYRVQSITESDLFDVRSELMNSTNPLRVKILLFSLLHEPFNQTVEHQLMLKSHELNELLRILFQSYKLFDDLEAKLTNVVKKIHQPEEYGAVVHVILRSVKPLYSNPIQFGQTHVENAQAESIDNVTSLVRTSITNSEATCPEQGW